MLEVRVWGLNGFYHKFKCDHCVYDEEGVSLVDKDGVEIGFINKKNVMVIEFDEVKEHDNKHLTNR